VSGRRVIRKAHMSSQLYPGPYQCEASDLLLEPNPDYHVRNNVEGEEIFADTTSHPATHKPEGVLMLSGPNARAGFELPSAHIYDITPTVLRIMGVPLPKNLDGKTLEEAFQPDSPLIAERIVYAETKTESGISDKAERLKAEGKR
jgi:predicted AlkP superfamily phosphohydrolase/phosphomutase